MYADENVIKIKHEVLYEVAKLAFEGELDAQRDAIAFKLIPGPTPQFRCCIYKEREILYRQYADLVLDETGRDLENTLAELIRQLQLPDRK